MEINEEPFLKNVNSISDFKLRLSWGQTGQQDTGMEYYTPTYVHGSNNHYTYPIGSGNDGTLWRPLTYNEDLTWETTTTYNVGLDFGISVLPCLWTFISVRQQTCSADRLYLLA